MTQASLSSVTVREPDVINTSVGMACVWITLQHKSLVILMFADKQYQISIQSSS